MDDRRQNQLSQFVIQFVIRHFPFIILLVAFALRVAPLTQNRFHPDEALYATFARLVASARDPLLSNIVVDKPPLPFYLMAASMSIFGGTELAARLPSLFASIISVALTFQLARSFYNRGAATFATLCLAASPLAILFAPTLFTDTLLSAFLLGSLLLVVRARWTAAGWMFGLAFATKQTALFFLPLILAISFIQYFTSPASPLPSEAGTPAPLRPRPLAPLFKFFLPVFVCTAAIFVWDSVRYAPISFWTQGYSDNNPGRLVRSNEIWPRLAAWADLLQYPVAPVVTVIALLVLAVLLIFATRSRSSFYDFTLISFVLIFLAGYWLLAFNIWDRYLVILAPLIAILVGRCLERITQYITHFRLFTSRLTFTLCLLLSAFCFLPSAITAAHSGYPIGGDHGAYDGIDDIAAELRTTPPGSVLYDFWLSWELGFYLFDGPTYLAWMPGPSALAGDLQAFGTQSPRYLIAPSWESFTETQAAIESVGYTAETVKQTFRRDGSLSFTLYQLVPSRP